MNNEGLKSKYIISKADGTPIDPKAKYFVLRYDQHMKDKGFLKASRLALARFCREIVLTFPALSQELWESFTGEVLEEHYGKLNKH